jgi:hypothetical protein
MMRAVGAAGPKLRSAWSKQSLRMDRERRIEKKQA